MPWVRAVKLGEDSPLTTVSPLSTPPIAVPVVAVSVAWCHSGVVVATGTKTTAQYHEAQQPDGRTHC